MRRGRPPMITHIRTLAPLPIIKLIHPHIMIRIALERDIHLKQMPRIARRHGILDVRVDVHGKHVAVGHARRHAALLPPGVRARPGDVDHHGWSVGLETLSCPDVAGVVDHFAGGRAAVDAEADAAVC